MQTVEQLECPLADGYKTNAETQEGAAARLVEHFLDEHPGTLPPEIVILIKGLTGHFK